MENPVERVLESKGPKGLSLRQLGLLLGIDKRRLKYHIYTSTKVMNADPFLHGSCKSRIRVFCFTPNECKYILRNVKTKKQKRAVIPLVPVKNPSIHSENSFVSEPSTDPDSGSELDFGSDPEILTV